MTKETEQIIRPVCGRDNVDLNYNISNSQLNFDNIIIDDKENSNLNNFVNNYNSFKKKNFNKVRFRNFINNLFESYDG